MIRVIDNLYRVSLSKDVVTLGWQPGTELEVTIDPKGMVTLKPPLPICPLCGQETEPLIPAGQNGLCQSCLDQANRRN